MLLRTCTFETTRLIVKEWHTLSPSDWHERDLPRVVAAMLTEPVTRSLPSEWQGSYTTERDRESTTLLVIYKSTQQAVGLMILSEMQAEVGNDYIDVCLGYFVSEDSWGQGVASELVDGFVTWCRAQTSISSIPGGVALDNPASQ